MNSRTLSCLAFAALVSTSSAFAQLEWRVSVKVILDNNGDRVTTGNLATDEDIRASYEAANGILDMLGRGYRFRITEILELSTVPQWFNAPIDGTTRRSLHDAAMADPTTYAYRNDAMNVYILGSGGRGWCARPRDGENQISILGQGATIITAFHEAGHVLGLCHTHGCTSAGSASCDEIISDEIDDTLDDCSTWTQDEIAIGNYETPYDLLPQSLRDRVDDVWRNVMSYHDVANRFVLTPDQLDRMTDVSNAEYRFLTNGRTWFVNKAASAIDADGSSTFPVPVLFVALLWAADGDGVLLQGGNHLETQMINQRVTLRASRENAVLGE